MVGRGIKMYTSKITMFFELKILSFLQSLPVMQVHLIYGDERILVFSLIILSIYMFCIL